MRDAWGGPLMVTRAGPEDGFLAVTGHGEVALPFLSVRGSAASLAEWEYIGLAEYVGRLRDQWRGGEGSSCFWA